MMRVILLTGLMLVTTAGLAAEPIVDPKDLPRIPATEPERALSTFQIKPGFHLELAAAEPLVVDPIAMSFDEDGRLYVVEMRDYSERRDERLGRIRCLEDTDGDGRFDKSTVFAENLPWPTAVFCYGGGVFVGVTPDVLYLKDTNGDGVADASQVVFTGFGAGTDRLNVQALMNSFNWGLDNRIHGASGPTGGKITCPLAGQAKPLELRGKDFSFDPRDWRTIRAEMGGGQHGLSFSDDGQKFVCHNSDHIRLAMYEERYAGGNAFYSMPGGLASIAVDGPAAEVYRLSPDEPWRVIRTAWRVAGKVPGPIEGGGRASGYFTSATGITIYRGNAFPEEFKGDAFIADVGSNLIHRKKLYPDGVGLIARRAPGEEKMEFLASKDNWFRPVQFANAPDGTLYIADMYREVVEHPWSLPESIKKHLDLNSGNDRGRIYRIVPDGFKQPKLPRLSKATTAELVMTLEHPNGWHRETAARLLYERQDKLAIPALERLFRNSKSPLGRLHALHALDGQGVLTPGILAKALGDRDERVREHGVRLSEKFNDATEGSLTKKLLELREDPAARVRYQLAFTLGEMHPPGRIGALSEILRRELESTWVQAAVLNSLTEGVDEMVAAISTDQRIRETKPGREFFRQLVLLIGARNQSNEVSQTLLRLARLDDPGLTFSLVAALGDGLQQAGSSLKRNGANLAGLLARAVGIARDDHASEVSRVQAIHLLGLTSFEESETVLLSLFDPNQSQAVQLAAVDALARFNHPDVASELIKRWASFTPRLRSEALSALLARSERAVALLKAVEENVIRLGDLSSSQVKFLRSHQDRNVSQKASKLLGNITVTQREEAVNLFLPALQLEGNAAGGKAIYLERCSSCHQLGSDGYALGPDLATVKNTGKEKMLVNIVDPNREVPPNYLSFLIETKEDESLIGLIANETATGVTLRQAFGREIAVPRSKIRTMRSQGQSMMPEGLEAGLTPQAMADLLEYIATAHTAGK